MNQNKEDEKSPVDIEKIYAKVTVRLIPFLFVCYICAYLDRVNVSFAKLQMSHSLGLSETVYGLGAGMFFIGYFFFEIPSNLLLLRIGARLSISRIMLLWGTISVATAWAHSAQAFYVLRFLLGAAEAGFFPGIIFYLTRWYPAAKRGHVTALFMTAVAVAGVLGAPISGLIMDKLNAWADMAGWQWLFILEGIPSITLGIVAFFYLDDSLEDARWLRPEERLALRDMLEVERIQIQHTSVLDGLRSARVWLLSLIYFLFALGLYGLNFWLPTMIKELGYIGLIQIGLIAAIPFGAAAVVMVVVSRRADHRNERRWHVAIPAVFGAAGLLTSALMANHPAWSIFALTVGMSGILASVPQTWNLATSFLGGSAAAAGIALINSVGNLAGFVAPYSIGFLKDATGSTSGGIIAIAISQVIAAILVLCIPAVSSARLAAGRN